LRPPERLIPKKGLSGIGTLTLCGVIMTYGFVKYIIRQREDNEYRMARARERSDLLPYMREFIIRRDAGDVEYILGSDQYKKHVEYMRQIREQKLQELGGRQPDEQTLGQKITHYWKYITGQYIGREGELMRFRQAYQEASPERKYSTLFVTARNGVTHISLSRSLSLS
jgi:hypothetical protein